MVARQSSFDFVGRKEAKTHGIAEDASKKIQGTVWIDEARPPRLCISMRASPTTFTLPAACLRTCRRARTFISSRASSTAKLWLPIGAEGTVQARVLPPQELSPAFQRARLRLQALQSGNTAGEGSEGDAGEIAERTPSAATEGKSPAMIAPPLAGNILGSTNSSFVVAEWSDDGGSFDPPRLIAPPHVHHNDDEAWYVLDGALCVRMGDETIDVPVGSGVLVPAWNSAHPIGTLDPRQCAICSS